MVVSIYYKQMTGGEIRPFQDFRYFINTIKKFHFVVLLCHNTLWIYLGTDLFPGHINLQVITCTITSGIFAADGTQIATTSIRMVPY